MSLTEKHIIKNPSITLYAFHPRTDLAEEISEDASLLWENLTKLIERLSAPNALKLSSKLLCYRNGQYDPSKEEGEKTAWLGLSEPRELTFSGQDFSGSVYPLRIHDTYTADLTLFCKDKEMEVSQLSRLNQGACLMPSHIRASLGQTLLFYAEVPANESDVRKLADECVKALLQDSNETLPPFVRKGRLFGSPVFEYEDYTYKPLERRHILVWLCEHSRTPELAQTAYNDLMTLFFCRNKILYAFHQSRESNKDARSLYMQLEKQIGKLDLKADPPERLKLMESLLAEMPPDEILYALHLRNLNDHRTTIKANIQNYKTSLEKIRALALTDDDLSFFDEILDLARKTFLFQIRTDLNILAPGQQLSQQIIAGIRGIVEIDTLRQLKDNGVVGIDTLRQLKENEESGSARQERLEIVVTFIVAVLSGATLSATVVPKAFGEETSHLMSVLLHLLFAGALTGISVYIIVRIFQYFWRK